MSTYRPYSELSPTERRQRTIDDYEHEANVLYEMLSGEGDLMIGTLGDRPELMLNNPSTIPWLLQAARAGLHSVLVKRNEQRSDNAV